MDVSSETIALAENGRQVVKEAPGSVGVSNAFAAGECAESKIFMVDIIAVCRKYGLALVPQSYEYEVSFHEPMRVVPLDPEIEGEMMRSWVCFGK